ncbi:MAG: cytochrome c-type biogenesis protein CcmH [Rhodoferax sp.]
MKSWLTLLTSLCVLVFSAAWGAEAPDLAEDPVVENRLIQIAEELRCLVCQNESLAGSRADLANDLRREVRTLIKSGKTDDEIKRYLVDRYGDFVLYRPPVKPSTWLLWFGPALLLLAAIATLVRLVRRSQAANQDNRHLSAEQRAQAQALLRENTSE